MTKKQTSHTRERYIQKSILELYFESVYNLTWERGEKACQAEWDHVTQSHRTWGGKKNCFGNMKDGGHLGVDREKECVWEIHKLGGCGSSSGSPLYRCLFGCIIRLRLVPEMVITLSPSYIHPDSSELEFTTLSSLIALSHIWR